ncbi:MAG: tetratricopeptide repeat protein [Thermodesulfobacteriota bacterium]
MRYFRLFIVVLAATVLLATPVLAQDLKAVMEKAKTLYQQGDYEGTITELRKALDILKKQRQLPQAQLVQMNIGVNYLKLGKFEEALREFEEAKALEAKPAPTVDLPLHRHLAEANYQLGRAALAASILEDLLKRQTSIEDKLKAELLARLADYYRNNEVHSKAVLYYQQALDIFVKLDNKEKQSLVHTALALSQAKLGDFPNAAANLEKAIALATELGKPLNLAESYSNLGIIHWDQGEYPAALDLILKAKEVEAKEGLKKNLGADFNNEGLIYKSAGNYPKALAALEEALRLAREIGDQRSEAIALGNRALVHRILGKNDLAKQDYEAALGIYQTVQFKEGTASCYLGLGKYYEVAENDYRAAYDYYQKALALYRELGNLTYQAETLNQIGRLLRLSIDPARTGRDLIFEDQPPMTLDIPPEEAQAKSKEAYQEALALAQKVNKREAVWSAQQGLGFALRAEGQDEEAFKYYRQAIETVVSIRGGSDSELLADYLKDKEDLFTEALDLLSALFAKTGDPEYQRLMMEYEEIYKNEVLKSAMTTARLDFQEPDKADLFGRLTKALAKKEKLDGLLARQQEALAKEPADPAGKAERELLEKDLAAEGQVVVQEAQALDQTIAELLAQWKQKYPADAGLFDSTAKVDVAALQKTLTGDQALIQYFPLPDKLSIILVTDKEVKGAEAAIPYADLASLIRDKFTYENIEMYGHMKTDLKEADSFAYAVKVLGQLYQVLLGPVESQIADKKKLIVVPSKYIAYVPFSALVSRIEADGRPRFLVQDKTVSYIRLSFFDQVFGRKEAPASFDQSRIIAVGNPSHRYLSTVLPDLPGAEKEVQQVVAVAQEHQVQEAQSMFYDQATETAWRQSVVQQPYTVYYFATHGVPYAELVYVRKSEIEPGLVKLREELEKAKDEEEKKKIERRIRRYENFLEFCDRTFMSKSPLNGFLYMAYNGEEQDDGVLTLKEIMEMPAAVFTQADLAVLSACNTAVTYSPKVDDQIRRETESAEVNKELLAAGWTPGVDQVCLADTFMKRNFNSVMGTLWFADDQATGFIIARFFDNLAKAEPAEALREAQLAYLERPPMPAGYTAVPQHPFYWAVSGIFGR